MKNPDLYSSIHELLFDFTFRHEHSEELPFYADYMKIKEDIASRINGLEDPIGVLYSTGAEILHLPYMVQCTLAKCGLERYNNVLVHSKEPYIRVCIAKCGNLKYYDRLMNDWHPDVVRAAKSAVTNNTTRNMLNKTYFPTEFYTIDALTKEEKVFYTLDSTSIYDLFNISNFK